jgi:hypothetical protein
MGPAAGEHLEECPYEGIVDAAECDWCDNRRTPCWVTEHGTAYHVRHDCPALHGLRTSPTIRKTVATARGEYQGCDVCVNGVCQACAAGRHNRCSPVASKLEVCACAKRSHRR